ncbi:acyl-phosphate glycerol 3-phosphate acyltransferase [candidate division WOR-1 bacterium RIFOXYC2_FULL_37_10]|nr:MAG: acyl-phosphate glycerol 3-phosphate acyltransferase [candidate division WOR-1 bacterium RIFOXYA2_FULL_37_7]OGC33609.1 MAG: acyl-phosphate glycerol 3-phosphate acyltransferase [candidate division WOR-1 bacterium RIFOXYC2_FULL_37_10]
MVSFFAIILFSYLIGAIPFSYILPKLFGGIDVRAQGSGNVGATNVLVATGSKKIAVLSAFLDVVKGFAVVIFAKVVFGADIYWYLAGLFAIIGHDFPVYLKFKGGKGVATTAGVIAAINPFAIWVCLIVYIISIAGTRYLILSTLITLAITPFILFLLGEKGIGFIFGVLFFLPAIFVHRMDIEMLLSGKAKKISEALKSV